MSFCLPIQLEDKRVYLLVHLWQRIEENNNRKIITEIIDNREQRLMQIRYS